MTLLVTGIFIKLSLKKINDKRNPVLKLCGMFYRTIKGSTQGPTKELFRMPKELKSAMGWLKKLLPSIQWVYQMN